MTYETLNYTVKGKVALIQLNRPESMNALEDKLMAELMYVTNVVEKEEDIGAVVLTGSGKAFCAGGDLRRLEEGFSPLEGYDYIKDFHPWLIKFSRLEKPVIAAVNGFAVGAGFCISLSCDIVLASKEAIFAQSFVNVGLIPDLGGLYFLPRLVGLQKAKELVFTGEKISAEEAKELGIVNKILPGDQLLGEAEALAQKLAKGPRVAHRLAKQIINQSLELSLEELLSLEANAQSLCFQTEDHSEAVKAFLEKRKPVFKGK